MTGAWLLLTVLAAYWGMHWLGRASLCVPLMMAGVFFVLVYIAASDVREYARVLRDGGR